MWTLTGNIGSSDIQDIDTWEALMALVCIEASERLEASSAKTVCDLLANLPPRPDFFLAGSDINIRIQEITNG